MGIYLNPDNMDFQMALNSEIYVDKSELIKQTNAQIYTEQRFICLLLIIAEAATQKKCSLSIRYLLILVLKSI